MQQSKLLQYQEDSINGVTYFPKVPSPKDLPSSYFPTFLTILVTFYVQ
jgi:hypothetical protein